MDQFYSVGNNTKEVEPFNAEEREKVIRTLPKGYARDFYEFAFWTGLRTGEQIGLRWKNVDLDRGYIYVRESVVKGKLVGLKTASVNTPFITQSSRRIFMPHFGTQTVSYH